MSQNDWRISLEFISVYLLEILHHLFHLKMQIKNYYDQNFAMKVRLVFQSEITDRTLAESLKIISRLKFFQTLGQSLPRNSILKSFQTLKPK